MTGGSFTDVCRDFDWENVLSELGWGGRQGDVNLGETIVDRHASGHQVAIYWFGRSGQSREVTYDQLSKLSSKFANVLLSLGVKKGDRIAGVLPRIPEALAIMLGSWKAGAIYVPIFTGFGPEAIRYRVNDCASLVLCTHHEFRSRLPSVRTLGASVITVGGDADASPGDLSFWRLVKEQSATIRLVRYSRRDPAIILYTSGSTGNPKGVEIATNFLAAVQPYMKYGLDLRAKDMFWPTGDPGWGYGLVCYHAALALGVPVVSFESTPTPEVCLDLLDKQKITNLATVPTILRGIMALGPTRLEQHRLALRCISSCGEPLNAEVVRYFQQHLGVTPADHYGSSENGLPLGNFNALDVPVKLGSMGRPMPGFEMSVVDDEGQELPSESVGQLAQRRSEEGYYSLGYWNDPTRTKAMFRNGWMTVGDLARRDDDGYFWFEGRDDDVIKTSGYRVGPFEVESALLEHPAVVETAVVGKRDELKGEIVKAFVVLKSGCRWTDSLAHELQRLVQQEVGKHACPREFEVVCMLPKTESGKIQRFRLRSSEGA